MGNLRQLLIIVLLTGLSYSNIFQNGLVIDDKSFIKDWEAKKSILNVPEFFKGALPQGQEGVYRPVRSILYALYYQIGGTNPFIYHLHSLLIHLASTILVYFITQELSKSFKIKHKYFALIAALLFGLHPIHTETITYISSSMEAIGLTFFLGAFYLYQKSKYLPSLILGSIAFFTTEFTLTLPVIIMIYDLCLRRRIKLKYYLPYFISAAVYVFIRFFILEIGARGPYLAGSIYLTFLTMLKVLVNYIFLTLLPFNQANNHTVSGGIEAFIYRGYNLEPIQAQSLFNLDIILSLIFLIGLSLVAVKSFKKMPLISFGIGWFFITLLPVSEIVPQGSVLNEKSLYLPSFGIILILTFLIQKVARPGAALVICVLIIAGVYGGLTYVRNSDWHDEIKLWSKDTESYPATNAYAYFQLGNAQLQTADYEEALVNYQKSFQINKYFIVALASQARVYELEGKNDLAIKQYQTVLQVDPTFWEAERNLEQIYVKNEQK